MGEAKFAWFAYQKSIPRQLAVPRRSQYKGNSGTLPNHGLLVALETRAVILVRNGVFN